MIEADLFSHLSSTITAVGSRIYPLRAPENFTVPLIVYQVTGRVTDHTMDGGVTLYTTTKFQIDVYASTYDQAMTIGEQVIEAMASWTVPLFVHFDNELHLDEHTVEPNLFRIALDWSVTHNR